MTTQLSSEKSTKKKQVGFIGLGAMGRPMAKNQTNDFNVTVYDVFPTACEELEKFGASTANSPALMAEVCEIIGICVRNDAEVMEVLAGKNGIFSTVRAGTIITIHSTIKKSTLFQLSDQAKKYQAHIVDAPVTGGEVGAHNKSLCYICGGEKKILEQCRPVFATSAKKIIFAGDIGSGISLKLCNNILSYFAFSAIHEAYKLASKCDLPFQAFEEVSEINGVLTPQMREFMKNRFVAEKSMSDSQFKEHFSRLAALGKKDLKAALDLATSLNINLPITEEIENLIDKVVLNEV